MNTGAELAQYVWHTQLKTFNGMPVL